MDETWKTLVSQQFCAAIDMLENDRRVSARGVGRPFPPAPFTLDEMDQSGVMPDRVYTKVGAR